MVSCVQCSSCTSAAHPAKPSNANTLFTTDRGKSQTIGLKNLDGRACVLAQFKCPSE